MRHPQALGWLLAALLLQPALLCAEEGAQAGSSVETPGETQSVTITAEPAQPLNSYRALHVGLAAFDRTRRTHGPEAQLRFRLLAAADDNRPQPLPPGVQVVLRGAQATLPLPLDAQGRFALPDDAFWLGEQAEVDINRHGGFGWFPDVRTPGVPPNSRRLGDLRLECTVLTEVLKSEAHWLRRAALTVVTLGGDLCAVKFGRYVATAGQAIRGAQLRSQGRTLALTLVSPYDFEVPLADASWPDDALIEFSFPEAVPASS
ncbi:hypothetical protein [Ideonella sp.]|uniref:hypothetical protein n=1 Tax=Ideonella sp. TaxID=1929293 RepID=UPI0035AFEA03